MLIALKDRVAAEDEGVVALVQDECARGVGNAPVFQLGRDVDELRVLEVQAVHPQVVATPELADQRKVEGIIRGGDELDVADAEIGDVDIKRAEGRLRFVGERNELEVTAARGRNLDGPDVHVEEADAI